MHRSSTHKLDAEKSAVHSVTIFQSDSAEIVRKFTIDLKSGDNVVEITHLPHNMVVDSLRVSGIGNAILSDVVCIPPKRGGRHSTTGKSETLIALEDEVSLVTSQKKVLDYQAMALVNYSRTLSAEHMSPDDFFAFLHGFKSMGLTNNEETSALDLRLRELEKKCAKEIEDPAEEHDSSHLRNMRVKLTISSDTDHAAEISLTYLVKKASWKPMFDLRAVTGPDGMPTNKFALHYRASVQQSTGEDWTDAILNLSTASPDSLSTRIPTLNSVKIVAGSGGLFGSKPVAAAPQAALFGQTGGFGLFGSSQNNSNNAQSTNSFGAFANTLPAAAPAGAPLPPAPSGFGQQTHLADYDGEEGEAESVAEALPQIEVPDAIASKNSMATNFQVVGQVNIRSDGSTHKVAIATLSLNSSIDQVVVPRGINGAYFHAKIQNSSKDTHLLPGSMSVYLDEGFIAQSEVPHVSPGDYFTCSLGRDYTIGVAYDQKSKRLPVPTNLFGQNQQRVVYTVTCTVTNRKDPSVRGLIVRDVIPVAEGAAIKVVLTKPAGLAEMEEGQELEVEQGVWIRWCKSARDKGGMKEGRLEWRVDLESRASKALVLEWEVSSPPGNRWGFQVQR